MLSITAFLSHIEKIQHIYLLIIEKESNLKYLIKWTADFVKYRNRKELA